MARNFLILLILVLVFLIPKQSFAANYYFNAAVDNDWANVLNWWEDIDLTIQSSVIPGTSDDVFIFASVNDISTGEASVSSAVFGTGFLWPSSAGYLTASGGGVVFSDGTQNQGVIYSTITTFNGDSNNYGSITGTATFNDYAYNSGSINGNVVFNDTSYNNSGINGNVVFNDTSYNNGTVNGNAIFEYASSGTINIVDSFWGGAISGTIKGVDDVDITNWIFNGFSVNNGSITGTATFNGDLSENNGTVVGTTIRRYTSATSPTRNLIGWTVVADGAVVDMSGATYDATTVLQTQNGGSFINISVRVSSSAASSISSYTATLNGSIDYLPNGNATEKGFIYGTTTAYGATTTEFGSFGIGSFSANISNLIRSTQYYFKAYSKDSINTTYGSGMSFMSSSPLSTTPTATLPFDIALSADATTAYVIGYDCNCLYIHDVTDKSNPTLLYSTSTAISNTAQVVANGNDYIYVLGYGNEIIVYNVTDPSNPIRVTTVVTPGLSSRKAHILDGYLYVTDSAGTSYAARIFDISNPALPTLIASLPGGVTQDGADVHKVGNYLYISDNGAGQNATAHLTIYDVSNVLSPVLVRTIAVGHSDYQGQYGFVPWAMLTKDNALYILDDNLLDVYDISSTTNPVFSHTITIYKDVEGFALKDNLLYFAGSKKEGEPGALVIFELSDPLNPVRIFNRDTGKGNLGMAVDSVGYIYAVSTENFFSGASTLSIYDRLVPPTVTNSTSTSLSTTGVTLNASITSDGFVSSTDRGFEYGATTSYGSVASTTGTFGISSFSESLSGLSCATTYHYRAFASNAIGTATTSNATFTTSACPTSPAPSSGGSSSSSGSRVSRQVIATIFGTSTPVTTVSPGISPRALFTRNLTTGLSGNDVKNLQIYLNSKGFTVSLTGPGSKGNETTFFGALTRQALVRFQKANNISPAVGFFGPITRAFITKNP